MDGLRDILPLLLLSQGGGFSGNPLLCALMLSQGGGGLMQNPLLLFLLLGRDGGCGGMDGDSLLPLLLLMGGGSACAHEAR